MSKRFSELLTNNPLSGTDIFALSQGATSRKVAVTDLLTYIQERFLFYLPAIQYSKPVHNSTRSSTNLGSLSTPWTDSITIEADESVRYQVQVSMQCAADEHLYIALARDGTIIDRGRFHSIQGQLQNHGILMGVDSPSVGAHTYEVYVGSNSGGTVTVTSTPTTSIAVSTTADGVSSMQLQRSRNAVVDFDSPAGVPNIGARVRTQAGQGVNAGNLTHIDWTIVDYDNGDLWVPGSPAILTAPIDGLYYINAYVTIAAVAEDIQYIGIWRQNVQTLAMQSVNAGVDATAVNLSAMTVLTAGQWISVRVFLSVNASFIQSLNTSDFAVIDPYLSMQLLRAL